VPVIHAWGMTELSPLGSFAAPRPGMAALDADARVRSEIPEGRPA